MKQTLQEHLAHFQDRVVTPELQEEVGRAVHEWAVANNVTHPSQMGGDFMMTFACGSSVEMKWTFQLNDGSEAIPLDGQMH